MAGRYGKNPIKDKKATGVAGPKEKEVHKQRQRGKAGTKSTATAVTRNTTTNARGGNKPLKGGTAAQAKSTASYLKRVQNARSKDAAAKAAKSALAAGAGKVAVKAALRMVPVVGTAMMAKDIVDAVTSEPKKTSKGGQMSRTKKK